MALFEFLPNEIVRGIMSMVDVKSMLRFAISSKPTVALISSVFGFGTQTEFFEHVRDNTCKFCGDINNDVSIGKCSACSIHCDECRRMLPRKLTIRRAVCEGNFDSASYINICRFGCRFSCAICERMYDKSKFVRRDDDGWIICRWCAHDFGLKLKNVKIWWGLSLSEYERRWGYGYVLGPEYEDYFEDWFEETDDELVATSIPGNFHRRNFYWRYTSDDYKSKYDPWREYIMINKYDIINTYVGDYDILPRDLVATYSLSYNRYVCYDNNLGDFNLRLLFDYDEEF